MKPRNSYKQIKQDVLEQIRDGRWRPGELIPKEQALADSLGCARMTVHRALRELAEEGVLERRRRSGTRVALQTSRNVSLEIPRVDHEIAATGAEYRYQRLSRRVQALSSRVAARLEVAAGTRGLRVDALHFANNTAFQLEQRWINLTAVPDAEHEAFDAVSPNVWLLEHHPWSDVEHVVRAINASAGAARRLGIDVGEALLTVERRTWSGGEVLTWVQQLHPGRFYSLSARTARS